MERLALQCRDAKVLSCVPAILAVNRSETLCGSALALALFNDWIRPQSSKLRPASEYKGNDDGAQERKSNLEAARWHHFLRNLISSRGQIF